MMQATQSVGTTRVLGAPVVNVKQLRQTLLDKLDRLPPAKWQRGIAFYGSAPELQLVVSRDDTNVMAHYRGKEVLKVRLNPDRAGNFQGKASNRMAMENALATLIAANTEVAAVLADS